jgi:MerR family redox-sensitive transcriptional activator SoxR
MKESSESSLSIGQIAARAGIRSSSIRYYESVGVLPEPERVSGQRRYTADVLDRLGFIDVAQQAGFSLEEIRELLESSEHAHASERLQALAQRKLSDIEALISRAEAMKGWLQAAGYCHCQTLEICALFSDTAHDALHSEITEQPLKVLPASSP